jgi:chromosome segregation ATPase
MANTPRNRPDTDGRRSVGVMEANIATLEKAVAMAEALGEQRRLQAEMTAKRVEALESNIATLEKAVAKAEALGERWRQEAEAAAKRADDLVGELVELTGDFVEMFKRMAEQTGATEKLRAEFEDFRSRSRCIENLVRIELADAQGPRSKL